MKVTVQHINQDRDTGAVLGFTDVAEVNVWHTEDVDAALEYAYRYTNNINGSWSMKIGSDANNDVTVLAPLHVTADGRTMGLRSTSMFDRLVLNGKTYKVSTIGFTELEEVTVNA
jgi:hypothetical protein